MAIFFGPGRFTAPAALLFVAAMAVTAAADIFIVSGTVRDPEGRPVAGVTVSTADGSVSTRTDASGAFRLALPAGEQVLKTSLAGFEGESRTITVSGDMTGLQLVVVPLPRKTEAMTVQAIRADDKAPVTKTDVTQEDIDSVWRGQEMPTLLSLTPSVTQYSDTGLGLGYNYFWIRGIEQTRINMTFDGVPLNDGEDAASYFVDYGNFASSVESAQIQRGVGTSTVGAASYGGSINFASVDLKEDRDISAQLGLGSFGTQRASLAFQSGRFGPDLKVYLRASYQDTDGFRDHSDVLQRSLFFAASHEDEDSYLKISGFMGHERSQLAYLATDLPVLLQDLRYNPLTPQDRDSFGQSLVQAQYTRFLGAGDSLSVQAYTESASGWYDEWADTTYTTLWEYGLNWRFLGGSLTYKHSAGPFSLTVGTHGYGFFSQHTRDVVGGEREYQNDNWKYESNTFAKAGLDAGRWHLWADAQVRWAEFRYEGDIGPGSVSWTFFNPKLGARYDLRPDLSAYASVGRTTREPTRSDLLLGEDNATVPHDLHAVKPESVIDSELGVNWKRRGLSLGVDLYDMEFWHEIALTGELSQIGLPLRRNVDRSYRRGVELDAAFEPARNVKVTSAVNASRNRIRTWTQFYDVYDASGNLVGSTSQTYKNVAPLLTPEFIANLGAECAVLPWVSVGAQGRYVSQSFLDNTNNAGFVTPRFFTMGASLLIGLDHFVKAGHPRLRIQVENLLNNTREWASGYSYLYYVEGPRGTLGPLEGIASYYPLATRAVFATLDLGL